MMDVEMIPPFKTQYQSSPQDPWVDFCFMDQLIIAAWICRYASLANVSDRGVRFLVMASTYLFNIHRIDGKIDLFIVGQANGNRRGGVRMVGVNGFFGAQSFVEDIIIT